MSAEPLAPAKSPKFMLCLMMFLQIFIWGAWFELGFAFIPSLGFTSWQNALIFGAFNVGAVVALLFSTQFADRKFAAEKFLALSHLIGGAAIMGLFFLPFPLGTDPGQNLTVKVSKPGTAPQTALGELNDKTPVVVSGVEAKWDEIGTDEQKFPSVVTTVTEVKDVDGRKTIFAKVSTGAPFWPFFGLMLLHCVFYVPTVSITNSIAFANLKDPAREFGPVRVWGTIGWIAASWPFIFILVDWAKVPAMGDVGFVNWFGAMLGTSKTGADAQAAQRYIFLVAGAASFVLALLSPALPHTPPKPATEGDSFAALKAAKLLKHPFILVLFVVTFIDAAVHQSFFYWTASFLTSDTVRIPENWVLPVMKIGQIAEILTMLVLGYVLKSLGWRVTMTLGVLGHAARFAVFAYYPEPWAAVAVNAVHGVCYAFFFATVYIFIDEFFPKDIRSSAQGLFNLLILGVGPFAANILCGELKDMHSTGGKLEYPAVFSYSMIAGLVGALLLVLFFHPPKGVSTEPVIDKPEEQAPPVA